jgi:hypothetical protein
MDQCMKDSGGLTTDTSNAKLDGEIASQTQRGVVVIPTAFVNTAAIRGALTPTNIFTAICAGYKEGTTPAICLKCGACSDASACIDKGYCPTSAGGGGSGSGAGVSTHTFLTSMFVICAAFLGVGIWQYKRTREEMRDQVRGILAEYMPLEDHGDGGMSSGSSPMDFARGGITTSLIS